MDDVNPTPLSTIEVEVGSPDGASDPLNLKALRERPLDDISVTRERVTVAVRRPKKTEFFRVHPDYIQDAAIIEHEVGLDRDAYWVDRDLCDILATGPLSAEYRRVRLFLCVNRSEVPFFWPAKLPSADGAGRSWVDSGLEIAEMAKTHWIRMQGDKSAGAYEAYRAIGNLGEPRWPSESFDELLIKAFKDRIVKDLDHPLIRELQGKV